MFVNTQLFREEALHFTRTGIYCEAASGTYTYKEYWDEQFRRCQEGYSVGGTRITGDHYFYLNFCRIKLTDTKGKEIISKTKSSKKTFTFPDFWDGDYEYFWAKEIARVGITKEEYLALGLQSQIKESSLSGGKHMMVGKARRKGYSYKNGAIGANKYNTELDSTTLICAFDKKYLYPNGTMQMTTDYLNFLNEHTAWAKRRQVVDKVDHRKASYIGYVDGQPIEKGFKSAIIALTFADNPDAARGKDASLILFEEAGVFPNLKASYLATRPTVEDGAYTTGQILLFGTGGDMESGTIDFEDMFYDPDTYNLLAFENIWDEDSSSTTCSFYVPDHLNKPGFIDKEGNSLKSEAKAYEDAIREQIKRESKDRRTLERHIVEHAQCPKEAFLRLSGNIFPTIALQQHLAKVTSTKESENAEYIGDLEYNEDVKKYKWKLNPDALPIRHYPLKGDDKSLGAILIFEQPYEDEYGNIPYARYIAGCDPYAQDISSTDSIGSTLILDRLTNRIVAEYTGRPVTTKEYYENVRKLLTFYNAICLYENQIKGMFDYFEFKKCLYQLADQPNLIKDIVKNSIVDRGKGMHMTPQLKDYGEELINAWLREENEGMNILNLNKLRCIPLIQELIKYNKDTNCDRVMALMMCLYQAQEMRNIKAEESVRHSSVVDKSFWNKPIFRRRR